jgi:hypothetical protein
VEKSDIDFGEMKQEADQIADEFVVKEYMPGKTSEREGTDFVALFKEKLAGINPIPVEKQKASPEGFEAVRIAQED